MVSSGEALQTSSSARPASRRSSPGGTHQVPVFEGAVAPEVPNVPVDLRVREVPVRAAVRELVRAALWLRGAWVSRLAPKHR